MLYSLIRPALFSLDAEKAHELSFAAFTRAHRLGLNPFACQQLPEKTVQVMGLNFPNPIGLAAGLDKNAAYVDALASFGFGFIEVGTVTPKPQSGNPKPRMFRLTEHEALINRLGFNNEGLDRYCHNLQNTKWSGIIGVNIGKNKDTANVLAVNDYLQGLRAAYERTHKSSYVTINISSPNTVGLRDLQAEEALRALITPLKQAQEELSQRHGRRLPMAVKIAPDLDEVNLQSTVNLLCELKVDAIISGNTTLSRAAVSGHAHAAESGGLSGAPLRQLANEVLAKVVRIADGRVPVIGVGGITEAAHAKEKLALGASLVQIYTGLIYRGPQLIADSVRLTCK
ncbi:MAG: hypothetical protein RLZZ502_1624 [Pseudomonadota bacterium]|jgi:dihydroorotate dehydrogenase